MADRPDQEISAQLKYCWMRALRHEWRQANRLFLGNELRVPAFALHTGQSRLGYWDSVSRLISISEEHIWSDPWSDVVETLLHEMAHQFVDEVTKQEGKSPHGDSFRQACEALGVSAAASRSSSGSEGGTSRRPRDATLRRIRRLLALASSSNVHEAQSAAAKARELMLRYNLKRLEREREAYTYRRLGKGFVAIPHERHVLSGVLQDHFFVETIWVEEYDAHRDRRHQRLEVCGTEDNVEFASFAHDFLVSQSGRLWQAEMSKFRGKQGSYPPHGRFTRRERKQYLTGLLEAFGSTLRDDSHRLSEEHGLVWVGDVELSAYYDKRHPDRTPISSEGAAPSMAGIRGRQEGRRLKIHKPVENRTSNGGKLLR